jgi:hypothetical protein
MRGCVLQSTKYSPVTFRTWVGTDGLELRFGGVADEAERVELARA